MKQTLFTCCGQKSLPVIKDSEKALWQQTRELLGKHLNKRAVVHCNARLSFIAHVYVTLPVTELMTSRISLCQTN